jgi:folate-binding protein YgfZ
MICLLSDRGVIEISGEDSRAFLQGLITNDVEALTTGKAIYAALLTPQGKILFDFFVADWGDGRLLIDCLASVRDTLVKRLTMYRLRAKIQIAGRDDLVVLASWDGAALDGIAFNDPRLAKLGRRTIAPRAEGAEGYLAHRLSLGVPEGTDFGSDKMFALDAGLDELNAIAFDKGCYVGQELTARMKHRGTARKRLLTVESTDKSPLVAGTDLRAGGSVIGEIVSNYGSFGFALVRLDRLDEAGVTPIVANGTKVRVVKQAWLAA